MEGSRVAAVLQCYCYCKSISVWQAGWQAGRRNETGRDPLDAAIFSPRPSCTYPSVPYLRPLLHRRTLGPWGAHDRTQDASMLHAGPGSVAVIHCTTLLCRLCTSQPFSLLLDAVIFASHPSTFSAAIHHICRPLRKDRSPSARLIREGQGRSFLLLHHTHGRSCLTSQTPPAHPHAAGFCFRLATDAADHQHPRSTRQRRHASSLLRPR